MPLVLLPCAHRDARVRWDNVTDGGPTNRKASKRPNKMAVAKTATASEQAATSRRARRLLLQPLIAVAPAARAGVRACWPSKRQKRRRRQRPVNMISELAPHKASSGRPLRHAPLLVYPVPLLDFIYSLTSRTMPCKTPSTWEPVCGNAHKMATCASWSYKPSGQAEPVAPAHQ